MITHCPFDVLTTNANRGHMFCSVRSIYVPVLEKTILRHILLRQWLLWNYLSLSTPLPVRIIHFCSVPPLHYQDCFWLIQWVKLLFCSIRSSCAVNLLPQASPKCPDVLIVPTTEILGFWLGWMSHTLCEKTWRKDRGWFAPKPSPYRQYGHETIWTGSHGLIPCCRPQKQFTPCNQLNADQG